ncbi:MAG: aconitase X catalytic domain-containing protein [Actinomycetota bacterium]|nr:aconitase X catalytic domain-containing protein [Actinomycetota bacterium]
MNLTLSRKDKEFLEGKNGESARMAMEVLVELAKSYGASKLIDIKQAHIDGCSFAATGQAGLEFAEKLAEGGGKVRVPTTLNITSRDIKRWKDFKVPKSFSSKSAAMEKAYLKMGCIPIWTCTPYQQGNIPRFGEHITWAESNAINFANSVLGARTARYGDFTDICAALTGRTPDIEFHLTENRRGQFLFKFHGLENREHSTAFYAAIGYLVGKITGDLVPVLQGIPTEITFDQLKALSAASASSGSVGLFHVVGITPEAHNLEMAFQGRQPLQIADYGYDDVLEIARELTVTVKRKNVDLIAVGCPHFSYQEVVMTLKLLKSRRIAEGVQFWIHTNQNTEFLLKKMGVWKEIEETGAMITTDTCILNWPLDNWDFKVLMTNSGKFAHYAPAQTGLEVIFGSLKTCVETAISGIWRGNYEL